MSSTVVIKDKTPILTTFLLPLLNVHASANPAASSPPFFLGISGSQGSGKSTLVTTLAATLRTYPHSLNVVVFSADDLYLTHADQVALRELYPDNKLVRHRGEPGTHDIELAKKVFQSLHDQQETKIPSYDKSAFEGQGDRADELSWEKVNGPYDLVIFEGWCIGFRPLPDDFVEEAWNKSKTSGKGTLGKHLLEHLLFVNTKLKDYGTITDSLNALIHIDAEDISYVYDWRIQQEHGLISSRGSGMTDGQIIEFVNGYMPAYELYIDDLRRGSFKAKGKQLRVVIGKDRNIVKVVNL
ncbi:P-loop containing nucleoside triphosphate hydrolase protein [Choiromyces venosus 120613-1]|uniref:P-loop containing nucleoside triphosphate hydrolase protein n=1 Tax=Choiromyces venosus 120613-1 TaxID=1336337 RepID=A0A3N4JXY5_9PEZI|nr:P-loop containing nucleoside triphosphate hydrolase protein [Choiromyces venosus 120613-1]